MINRKMIEELAKHFVSARDYYDLLDSDNETSFSQLRDIVIEGFKKQCGSECVGDEMFILYNKQFFTDCKEKNYIKSFTTFNKSIEWLRKHLSLSPWDSKKESYTILSLQTKKPFHCGQALNTEYGDEDYNHFVWWDKSASLPVFYNVEIPDLPEKIICLAGLLNGCDEDAHYIVDVTRMDHFFDSESEMISYFNNNYPGDYSRSDFILIPLNDLYEKGII